jgi:hypothetical protein
MAREHRAPTVTGATAPSESATVRLTRDTVGIELRRGIFTIEVDGNDVGSIEWQHSAEVAVEPGHHVLRMWAGRYSSRELPFDVGDGETVHFRCHGERTWPVYLVSIVRSSLGISLKREQL